MKKPSPKSFDMKTIKTKAAKIFASIRQLSNNTKLAGSLAVVLVLVAFWTIAFTNNNSSNDINSQDSEQVTDIETAPVIKATLTFADGIVELKNDSDDWSDAKLDTELTPKMGLRTTGAASKAIVTLEDGSEIRIDANTEISFDSLTESRVVLNQKNGYIYNRVIPSDTRSYVVHTDAAQFQAIGTAFRTTASGDEEAVEVFESSIKETVTNLEAKEGEKLIIKNVNKPSLNKTNVKLNIETIKADAFIVWNRELDQKNPIFASKLGYLKDFEGPKIKVQEPAVGSTIEVAGDSQSGSVNIKGTIDSGSSLQVQSKSQGGSSAVQVTVNSDGSFETGALTAPLGNSVFEFTSRDSVGNISSITVSYLFQKKTVVQKTEIILTVETTLKDIVLEWGLVGITSPDGVKILTSLSPNIKYPTKPIWSETGTTKTIKQSEFESGKTYYFKVCRFISSTDQCDIYSNEVKFKIP